MVIKQQLQVNNNAARKSREEPSRKSCHIELVVKSDRGLLIYSNYWIRYMDLV